MDCKYCYKITNKEFDFLSPCLCESARTNHASEKDRLQYIRERELTAKQTKRLNNLKRDNTESYKF